MMGQIMYSHNLKHIIINQRQSRVKYDIDYSI